MREGQGREARAGSGIGEMRRGAQRLTDCSFSHQMTSQILETARAGRRVLVDERAVRELRMLAIEGFVALRRRGLEVGGILFGQADGEEVRIETFAEAPCEHRFGPSYRPSESDREKLGELLDESRRGPVPVLGFFQSFTAREPVIEDFGEAFMREHFPQGDSVYLMLQPLSAEICVASFRFFRDGDMLPDSGDPPFVFDPRQMATVMAPPAPVRAPLPPPRRRRDEEREEARAEAPDRTLIAEPREEAPLWEARPARRRARWWIPVAVCLLVGATGGVISEMGRLMNKPQKLPAVPKLTITPPQSTPPAASQPARPAPEPAPVPIVNPTPPVAVAATSPVAVHEVRPAVPEGIRARIAGDIVVIPVKVDVSERGRVVRAVAESRGGDGVRRYLADLAQKAARQWQFTPARSRSGEAVAGSKRIEFVFAP
jgi:hypothetical protein